jgi:hypothetical protein
MLNSQRINHYTRELKTVTDGDGYFRLTGPQRRRVQHKRRSHSHLPDQHCGLCRVNSVKGKL